MTISGKEPRGPGTEAGEERGKGRPSVRYEVPRRLEIAAAIGWRALVVAAALLALGAVLAELRIAFLALFFALFATALLRPLSERLIEGGWPSTLAAAAVLLLAISLFGSLLWLIVPPFVGQLRDLGGELADGVDAVHDWLKDGPLDLSEGQIDDAVESSRDTLADNTATIVSGVFSGAQILVETIVIALVALVLTFFFLRDGDRITAWLLSLVPPERRAGAEEVARRSWSTLASYLRGVTIVALFDAVFIGLALVIVGVPAALPLAVLTFFGAYIPIAGAVVTGLLAVIVALIGNGLVPALIVLGAVIAVQQIESNALQPVVVGRAVAVHPVAILLAVTCGALIAGIIGALVAVPIAAVVAQAGAYLREQSPRGGVPAG